MNFAERFRQLAKERGLRGYQLAELFGVSHQVMSAWMRGDATPRFEFQQTLARFEKEAQPAISPQVSEATAKLFLGMSA